MARKTAEERDLEAQEHGPGGVKPARVAGTYLHATHPEHGEEVVFVPGELLPDWYRGPTASEEAGF